MTRLSKVQRQSINALKSERQQIAFDANVHKRYGFGGYAERCAKRYDELTAAIAAIENRQADAPAKDSQSKKNDRQLAMFEESA